MSSGKLVVSFKFIVAFKTIVFSFSGSLNLYLFYKGTFTYAIMSVPSSQLSLKLKFSD